MFRSTTTEDIREIRETLREQLRDRFRAAVDFATLGAYELTGPDPEAEQSEAARPTVHRGPEDRRIPKRVFLFAKVAPSGCSERPARVAAACSADRVGLGARDVRRRQRRPATPAAEQPCTWAPAAQSLRD